MFEKIVPVNKDVHAHTKVREITSFAFASRLQIADVTMQEFTRAAAIFPIVFVEDKDKDAFRPVVLLGLNVGQNLFVDAAGKWRASYVPAVITRFLSEHNIFTPLNLRVRDNSNVKNILGCYAINEERLNNLSDELFLEIKNQRYLPAIYDHLIALAQTECLVTLQEEASARDG